MRRLKTKDIDWFLLRNNPEHLHASLVLNDKDRSKDFSEDPVLQRLRKNDEELGDEYMKVHLFIESKEAYERFVKEIYSFYEGLIDNLNVHSWLFVHIVKNEFIAAEKYLIKWGISKSKWEIKENNPFYDHLSQDWNERLVAKETARVKPTKMVRGHKGNSK